MNRCLASRSETTGGRNSTRRCLTAAGPGCLFIQVIHRHLQPAIGERRAVSKKRQSAPNGRLSPSIGPALTATDRNTPGRCRYFAAVLLSNPKAARSYARVSRGSSHRSNSAREPSGGTPPCSTAVSTVAPTRIFCRVSRRRSAWLARAASRPLSDRNRARRWSSKRMRVNTSSGICHLHVRARR
jgi:hypothetical protein